MPCEFLNDTWICTRSRLKTPAPSCYKCGKAATVFCDFREYSKAKSTDPYGQEQTIELTSLDTCDKPMCRDCAVHVDDDLDYCEEHSSELSIVRSRRSDAVLDTLQRRKSSDHTE